MARICGIDPGAGGALALLDDDRLVEVIDMPIIEIRGKRKINASALVDIAIRFNADLTIIEEVGVMPRQGIVSGFNFGYGAGLLEGIHAGLGRSIVLVRPNIWKKAAGVPADKGAARQMAARLWPEKASQFARVKDDGRAEAALLARWQKSRLN